MAWSRCSGRRGARPARRRRCGRPSYWAIGPDYLCILIDLRNRFGLDDAELHRIAKSYGHPAELPWVAMSGGTFRGVIRFFAQKGAPIPPLGRSWMDKDRIDFVEKWRRALAFDAAQLDELLRDFGGGVSRIADLHECDFSRLYAALEARTLIIPTVRQ